VAVYWQAISIRQKNNLRLLFQPQIKTKRSPPRFTLILQQLKQAKRSSDGVENVYQKALAISSDYYTAHFNLGLFYKRSEQFEKAEHEFREALRCNYTSPSAHQNLAEVLRKVGKLQEAEKHERIAKDYNENEQ
jgi:tetratricopeptide (TPR) repeat protein